MPQQVGSMGRWRLVSRLVLRGAALAAIWWALTEGRPGSWLVGGPVIVVAALVSLGLSAGSDWSPGAWLRFMPFFVWHSLKGGVDVAIRAFQPSLPLDPLLVDYPLRLPPGPAPVFMANVASLLPGTLAAGIHGDRLQVHVLDRRGDFRGELEALEGRIAAIFRLPIPVGPRPD